MPGLISKGAKWAYPDMKAFRKKLRELAESRRVHKKDAEVLGEHIRTTFIKKSVFQKIRNSSLDVPGDISINTEDLEKQTMQAIQHTTVMMNLGSHIGEISEKSK
jgi:hypothetical protein